MDVRLGLAGCSFLVAFCLFASHGWAQSTELQDPVAIAVHPENGHAFIVADGNLIRWDGTATKVLASLADEPVGLEKAIDVTFRDGNRVTVLGADKDGIGTLATWSVDIEKPARFEAGLSGPIKTDDALVASCLASTDLAIYVGLQSEAGSKLWRIPAGQATLGKAEEIFVSTDEVTAITVNQQGHVVAACKSNGESTVLPLPPRRLGEAADEDSCGSGGHSIAGSQWKRLALRGLHEGRSTRTVSARCRVCRWEAGREGNQC